MENKLFTVTKKVEVIKIDRYNDDTLWKNKSLSCKFGFHNFDDWREVIVHYQKGVREIIKIPLFVHQCSRCKEIEYMITSKENNLNE